MNMHDGVLILEPANTTPGGVGSYRLFAVCSAHSMLVASILVFGGFPGHPMNPTVLPSIPTWILFILPDDYRDHTSCMSESQRYEQTRGDQFNNSHTQNGNGKKAKKQSPQEAWMALIQRASQSASPDLKHYMNQISMLDNVPRKEKQFRNFTSNSLNLRGRQATTVVEALWKYLSDLRNEQRQQAEAEKKKDAEAKQQQQPKTEEDTTKDDETAQEKPTTAEHQRQDKNQSSSSESAAVANTPSESSSKLTPKKVRKTMKKVLKKSEKKSMKIKELRSAILRALDLDKLAKEKLKVLLQQQLEDPSTRKKIKVDGKIVTLVSKE